MQESSNNYKLRLGLWILLVIYLLQVDIISGLSSQQIPVQESIPDSDETVISNSTSTGNGTDSVSTNVEKHISDFVPKGGTLPKKVQTENVSGKKGNEEEKTKPARKDIEKKPVVNHELPPTKFPEGTETIADIKTGEISKTAEQFLKNTKDEKATEVTIPPMKASEKEFPPKLLPNSSVYFNDTTKIPLIVNNIKTTNVPAVFPSDNSTGPVYNVNKTANEAFDMTHSKKYLGQYDPDDVKHIAEKFNKTKAENSSQVDPKNEVDISKSMDKNGPKLMPANKNGGLTDVLTSTSNIVAISSAVLSSKPSKPESMLQPIKAIAATVMTIVGMTIFGMAGFLLWRRIMQRRFGHREMLINEDDFEEVSDLHHFEGTTPTPNLIA